MNTVICVTAARKKVERKNESHYYCYSLFKIEKDIVEKYVTRSLLSVVWS